MAACAVLSVVPALVVPPDAAAVPPDAAAVPLQSQIDATQAQIASLEQTIAQQQANGAALAQRYDAAVQQSEDLQAAIAATDAHITTTKRELAVERTRLVRAALNAYMLATPVSQTTALFTSPATKADARAQYEDQAVGGLTEATRAYAATAAHLTAERSRQHDQQQQVATVLDQVQSLRAANAAASKATQAVLTSAQGVLAQQVAAQAAADAAAAAAQAAAQAVANAAAARRAAQAAANAASVASTLGDSAAAEAAVAAANQAAAAAGTAPSIAIGGAATGSPAGMLALQAAVSQLGVPYVWGGNSPSTGFDCSGLTQWSWAQVGVSIPRVAASQWASLPHVSLSTLQPGDLLFYFNLDGDETVDHVVMYAGSGPYGTQTVIQAPHTGATVSYSPLFTNGLIGAARP